MSKCKRQKNYACQETLRQPLQCVLQHHVDLHLSTYMLPNIATIRKPFQCDLQPQRPKHPITTYTRKTTRYRTQRRNPLRAERPQPCPPQTGGTFHRWLQPLYTEERKVSCSGFLPNTSPMQHSCSHYNALCSIAWQTCMYLRTWQQNLTITPIMSHSTAICNHSFQNTL